MASATHLVSEQPLALSRRDVLRLVADGKERCNGRWMNEVNVGVENASGQRPRTKVLKHFL